MRTVSCPNCGKGRVCSKVRADGKGRFLYDTQTKAPHSLSCPRATPAEREAAEAIQKSERIGLLLSSVEAHENELAKLRRELNDILKSV